MIRFTSSRTAALLVAILATTCKAFEAVNTLVASSPFELYLQPTFVELNLEAQTIAAQTVGDILSSAGSNLRDFDVVVQNVAFHPRRRRLQANTNLNLPSTTLTFAVLGTFPEEMNGQRDYLNTLIQDTFNSNAGRLELLQSLKSKHDRFKDLVNLQVLPTIPVAAYTDSDDVKGFLESLSLVDIILIAVSVCVLLGVTYMVVMSHRANRREHRRVLQILSNHQAAANALGDLEHQESASISSRLQLLKSSMRRSNSLSVTPLDKATEEEEATDEEDRETSKEETQQVKKIHSMDAAEHVPSIPSQKSSSSYHSAADMLAASRELASTHSMRSDGIVSDHEVIPSPQSSSDEDDDENYSESETSGYSSGISSAHFSSSRWFQGATNTPAPTPSEDTFDVFAIDVEKYDDKLLLDDGSKTSITENFLEEWVKAIQVVPGEKSSADAPGSAASTGSASTPECASVQSGEIPDKDVKEAGPATHEVSPEKSEDVTVGSSPPDTEA